MKNHYVFKNLMQFGITYIRFYDMMYSQSIFKMKEKENEIFFEKIQANTCLFL